jgi:leucine dehydrogenase
LTTKHLHEIYAESEHERVVFWSDDDAGYRGIIAVHSTLLGPAVGGVRFWDYGCEKEASLDALRLSRAMTYKNALAGLPFGGGKSIIIGDNRVREGREQILRAHGRFVDSLGGSYIAAEDVGTTPEDVKVMGLETRHVAGLPHLSGDPSPMTAYGVLRAVQASAQYRWGSDRLAGRTVSVQGCGKVGYHLAGLLRRAGAELIISDVDAERAGRVAAELGATVVAPEEILDAGADIFAPCALGGVVNDESIPRLKAEIVAGSANNQLLEARHGDALAARGILYAPDYVANSGGVISGCSIELLGLEPPQVSKKVHAIYETLLSIFRLAERGGISPARAADRLAEQKLEEARRRATAPTP